MVLLGAEMDVGIFIDSWASCVPVQQRQPTASWAISTEEIIDQAKWLSILLGTF